MRQEEGQACHDVDDADDEPQSRPDTSSFRLVRLPDGKGAEDDASTDEEAEEGEDDGSRLRLVAIVPRAIRAFRHLSHYLSELKPTCMITACPIILLFLFMSSPKALILARS